MKCRDDRLSANLIPCHLHVIQDPRSQLREFLGQVPPFFLKRGQGIWVSDGRAD